MKYTSNAGDGSIVGPGGHQQLPFRIEKLHRPSIWPVRQWLIMEKMGMHCIAYSPLVEANQPTGRICFAKEGRSGVTCKPSISKVASGVAVGQPVNVLEEGRA